MLWQATATTRLSTSNFNSATGDEKLMQEKKSPPAKHDVIQSIKIFVFGVCMMSFFIIGLMLFLRPKVSMIEKRPLAEFPEFTAAGLWDGSFFKKIDIWYSDTYPLREEMIAASKKVESFYGSRSEQIIEGKNDQAAPPPKPPAENQPPAQNNQPEPEENLPDGTIHGIGEIRGQIYIANNSGYELYTFLEDNNLNFVKTMNDIYSRFRALVNFYVMLVPNSAGVMLDKSALEYLGTSDEAVAFDFVLSRLDGGILKVNSLPTLRKHNAEYIFFHTDHHWTGLGAYYAYVEFCKVKGIQPHDIKNYEQKVFPGFLGSFYSSSNQSPEIAANPDTVIAYLPKDADKMTIFDKDGAAQTYPIIIDVSDYHPSALYGAFVAGDVPLAVVHNDKISDGSGVLVIKDSMGNAFIPWLVDHYENIVWVDPRYFEGKISDLVHKYHITDLIFEVGVYNASNTYIHKRYDQISW